MDVNSQAKLSKRQFCLMMAVIWASGVIGAAVDTAYAQSSWQTFYSPLGDFSVSVPTPLLPKKDDKNWFQAVASNHSYLVASFKSARENTSTESFVAGATDAGWTLKFTKLVSGNGWSGKEFAYTGNNGASALTSLWVQANGVDVAYGLSTDWAPDSEQASTFIHSFTVDPTKAAAVHANDPKDVNSASYEIGKVIGYCLPLVFLFWFLFMKHPRISLVGTKKLAKRTISPNAKMGSAIICPLCAGKISGNESTCVHCNSNLSEFVDEQPSSMALRSESREKTTSVDQVCFPEDFGACKSCGSALKQTAKFCQSCGASLHPTNEGHLTYSGLPESFAQVELSQAQPLNGHPHFAAGSKESNRASADSAHSYTFYDEYSGLSSRAKTVNARVKTNWYSWPVKIVGIALGSWLGRSMGLGVFILIGGAFVLYLVGKKLASVFLVDKVNSSRLVSLMLWSNLVVWCLPPLGVAMSGATSPLAPLKNKRSRFFVFICQACLWLSVINCATGWLDSLAQGRLKLAENALKSGKYDNAIALCNEAFSTSLFCKSQIHYTRAKAEVGLKNYQEALIDYEECDDSYPDDPEIFKDRAELLFSMQKFDKAAEDMDKFIERNPNDANAYAFRGTVNQKLNREENAMKDFNQAKSLGYKVEQ
jgi:tetratricopeptide (TPR) repeat protein